MPIKKGKFWPQVRELMKLKAQELYQEECCKTMDEDFSGVTATQAELREGGYMHTAKLLVLDEIWRNKGLQTVEEGALMREGTD